ncbi:DUF4163 domain-containing protein [Paenibacillus sp. H1-7]|uniref:PdaC/SigV domain-containing protein n=1 Tax=Paenibacillus sp. H1-7 TaxID=2282849 RepID=UPI001EF87BF4|nr:DUF4163 domain-containing protein [Paenibacillus sp. H1-7]ULL17535.1 DUF4163 domain-containing protein [Paenibacillus sp. H1-7]
MKTPFKLMKLSVAGCCLIAAYTPSAFAADVQAVPISAAGINAVPISAPVNPSSVVITAKTVKEQSEALNVELSIPVVQGLKDKQYEAELNDMIYQNATKGLELAKKQAQEDADYAKQAGYVFRPHELMSKYEMKTNGTQILSLKLLTYAYTGGAHGMTVIETYNVSDRDQAARIELKDLFGDQYKDIINKQIQDEIAKKPENYFADGFKGISDTQAFYIENGQAVIVFSEYEIAPYAAGSPEFRIPIPATSGQAEQALQISSKPIKEQTDELTVNISIPVVQGMKDTKYQAELNDSIYQQARKDLDAMKLQAKQGAEAAKQSGYEFRPYDLTVAYEVKADGGTDDKDHLSIKTATYTYTGGAHGMTRIDTYNVSDQAQAARIELKDMFGSQYKDIINKFIKEEIAKKPENYFADGFKGISDTQTFYIEKGNAVIVFGQYEIAPYSSGTPEFRIPIPQQPDSGNSGSAPVKLVVGGKELSLVTNSSGMAFAPLRAAAESLGYEIKWNADKKQAEVIKGAQWTAVTVGQDSYAYNKMAPIQLGAAPYINEEGSLFVPVDFFAKILKSDVISESGMIVINNKS